jgi:hypothetical protein
MSTAKVFTLSILFFALILVSANPEPSSSSGSNLFKAFKAAIPGRVQDLVIEDIDRDGLKDLFITYVEGEYPTYSRGITIFFQNRGGFSNQSRQDIKVPDSVALVDMGNVDAEAGLDIVCLCQGNVSYYPLRGRQYGALIRLFAAEPFTAMADENALPYYDFLQDWNRDGKDELLLLGFDRSQFYRTGASGLDTSRSQQINLEADISIHMGGPERMFQEHFALRAFYFMPQLNVVDYDGDGKVDLVGSNRSKLRIFKQLQDGNFSREPSAVININLPRPAPKDGKKQRGEPDPPNLIIEDVNRDGKMDVIASQLTGTISDLKSQTFIYYGHTGALARNKPDQLIQRNQAASFALIRDIDGDKTFDLVIPYINIDILSVAQMIVTTSANVNFAMYTIAKGKTYPSQPTGVDTTSIKFNLREMAVEGGVPNVDGDFDGDGMNDVVVGKNMTELHVNRGHGKGIFDDKPWAVIPVPSPLFPDVDDLNGDRLADIVVSYIPYHDQDHIIYVFMNQSRPARPPAPRPAAPRPPAPRPATPPK